MVPANYEGGGAPAQGVADPFVAPDPDSYDLHLYQFDGHWSNDSKRIVFVYDILQGTDGKLQLDIAFSRDIALSTPFFSTRA